MKRRVQLVSWDAGAAAERHRQLEKLGYEVHSDRPTGPAWFGEVKDWMPFAVVIDLSRAPATGRDIALSLRTRKATRHLPILMVEGDPQIARIVPGAVWITWDQIAAALKTAGPVVAPQPVSAMAGYAGTPLAKKLTIKAGMRVALLGEPAGVRSLLDVEATFVDRPDSRCALAIWFVHSVEELESEIEWIAGAGAKSLWIAWAKGGSLKQTMVRAAAKTQGLAEYKICSIDGQWSALLFTGRGE